MSRAIRLDLGWSLLWGTLFALGPHTGQARPIVSVVGGGMVAGAVLALRRLLRRRGAAAEPAPPLFARTACNSALVALLAGAAAVFAPTLLWLAGEYSSGIWRNGHGWFVPVFIGLLASWRLRGDPVDRAEGSAWGLLPLLLGTGLALLDAGVRSGLLAAAGLVIALPGLSLLLLGARRTRLLAAPLALAVFLIPLPEQMPDPLGLPRATAIVAEPILKAIGFAVERQSTIFVMREVVFKIGTNCSGVATLYGATFFAALLATHLRSWTHRLTVLAAIWPATVAVNGLRCVFLFGMTDRFGERVVHSPIHGLSGIATFWLVMALLWAIAGLPAFWRARK